MIEPKTAKELALKLDEAERTCTQLRQFTLEHPGFTIEDAYAVQRAWVTHKLSKGRTIKGHKIGLTSKAMQNFVNINEPDYGALLDDMFYYDGAEIPMSRLIEPRVEVELAFVLGKKLEGPNCTIFDVLRATDYVTPAMEIIDARVHRVDPETKTMRKVMDTISDNAANTALVIGGRPFKPDSADLRWVAALLYRNGQIELSGVAAAVLNHPANGPAWLANKLALYGESLQPGEVILGGSFTAPISARAGDTFHADYGTYGSISCYFK
jgi:2-oxo-hept-3-ene-1,7-dioate hydratase